jgi:hypothetical protein
MSRYFTLAQANETLLEIKPLVAEIINIRQAILDRQPEVWPVIQKSAGNGGSKAASRMAMEFERLDELVHRIQDLGVLMKDINLGLLDFPHLLNGREIYLCWKHGEDRITFWHEVEAGFAGRRPIEELG